VKTLNISCAQKNEFEKLGGRLFNIYFCVNTFDYEVYIAFHYFSIIDSVSLPHGRHEQ
jgi:hypothetical protein